MSAFVKIVVGSALVIGLGAAAFFTGGAALAALGTNVFNFLLAAGASLVLGGIGTLLSGQRSGLATSSRNPVAPWNVIYGRTKIGGTIVYVEENGDTNKYLHLVLVVACHQCDAIESLLFDGKRVVLDNNGNSISFGDSTSVIGHQQSQNIASISRTNDVVTVTLTAPIPPPAGQGMQFAPLASGDQLTIRGVGGLEASLTMNGTFTVTVVSSTIVTYINGGDPVTVTNQGQVYTNFPDYGDTIHMEVLLGNHTSTFPGLVAASSGLWTQQHLLLGRTAVYLQLKYGGHTYDNGLPSIAFIVRGKNNVFDPRSNSYGYTENAALVIADYLANTTFGFKVAYATDIPIPQLVAAANICDEPVAIAAGGSEPRYQVNGTFTLETKRGEVLQNLLTACAGRLTYTGGQYVIWPAAWNPPSITIGDDAGSSSTSVPMLMNSRGLVVNAYNNFSGRGDYFSESSGTSEGQALLIDGFLNAYQATGNTGARDLAKLALSNVLAVLYRHQPIPAAVDSVGHNFAPHWLFNVKHPYQVASINYTAPSTFSNGQASLADSDGVVHLVFQVITPSSTLLWQNPYAPLTSGSSYPFTTSYNAATRTTQVTLTGSQSSFSGSLIIIYSRLTGPTLNPGDPNEAWPDWRVLAPGEIASAIDTYNWFYRAYTAASSVLGAPWDAAAAATKQQAAIVYDVDDQRDWLKLSYTGSPFSDGSRFSYVNPNRSPAPTFSSDASGNVLISAPKSLAVEMQYGNASIGDTYNTGDSTTIQIGSNIAQTVNIFIDPAQTYNASNRYTAVISLNGSGLQNFTLTAANFTNPAGQALPAGTSVYTIGVSDSVGAAHVLTIGRIRQLPALPIQYKPGALPFTANFLGQPAILIDWRGPAYVGYQSPWMWKQIGNETGVANSLQMLADSQASWTTQTGQAASGPFAPVFYFARQDAVSYGPVNTFGWNGPDPNTKWGGYQYRPLAEVAELVRICNGSESYYSRAVSIADSFLNYIDSAWTNATGGPPTDYPIGSAAQVNYPEPHMVALILRAALLMDQAKRPNGAASGAMAPTYQSLLTKAMTFYAYWYQTSGIMAGTFCNDVPSLTWFGFWHGEILRTLSLVITWSAAANQPTLATQARTWIAGMIQWAADNIVDVSSSVSTALRNVVGPFQWKPTPSLRDRFNGVKGIYVSPGNNWQSSDIPPYAQDQKHGYSNGPAASFYDANLAADGGDRRWMEIQLPFTISAAAAQRLAKIALLRNRYGGSGTFAFNLSMYRATALDVLEVTLPYFGWNQKLLEVSAHRFTQNRQTVDGQDVTVLGAEIDVVETGPDVYVWSATEELTAQGFQQAALPPSAGVPISYTDLSNQPTFTVNGV